LIIGGLGRVYEIGKDFRNEGISTQHNPEFTQMECYCTYFDYQDMMKLVEEMISFIASKVLGTNKITYQGHKINLGETWKRLTLQEALKKAIGIDISKYEKKEELENELKERKIDFNPQPTYGKLVDELFGEYVEESLIDPTFIMDYPVEISPLAKKKPGETRWVERFEPFVGGLELGNAFTELNDPLDQRERFSEQERMREMGDEEAQTYDEDFLTAMEYGMPPTGGLGIGIDRLVMLFTNSSSIKEVILFPTLRANK
jgi:lysyl-tRNA synthetase class 2